MANAVRVENISSADRELAPGSGLIPAGGFVDYPAETYREKHERYAKPLLEHDPPLLKVSEHDSAEIGRRAGDLEKQAVADRQAEEAKRAAEKQAEELRKQEEQRKADEQQHQKRGR